MRSQLAQMPSAILPLFCHCSYLSSISFNKIDKAKLKVADFGCSKLLKHLKLTIITNDSTNIQNDNTSNVGTPRYRAPELLTKDYNEKVDIYSLGVILRELFENCINNLNETFIGNIEIEDKISKNEPVKLNSSDTIKTSYFKKLEFMNNIVRKMLDKEPDKRPSCEFNLDQIKEWKINHKLVLALKSKIPSNASYLNFFNKAMIHHYLSLSGICDAIPNAIKENVNFYHIFKIKYAMRMFCVTNADKVYDLMFEVGQNLSWTLYKGKTHFMTGYMNFFSVYLHRKNFN